MAVFIAHNRCKREYACGPVASSHQTYQNCVCLDELPLDTSQRWSLDSPWKRGIQDYVFFPMLGQIRQSSHIKTITDVQQKLCSTTLSKLPVKQFYCNSILVFATVV